MTLNDYYTTFFPKVFEQLNANNKSVSKTKFDKGQSGLVATTYGGYDSYTRPDDHTTTDDATDQTDQNYCDNHVAMEPIITMKGGVYIFN